MRILRSEALYRTDARVRRGDEFYQITLVAPDNPKTGCFEVRTFRGRAGTPPGKPAWVRSFQTRQEAEREFAAVTEALDEKGFCPYNAGIHGPDIGF